MTQATLAPDNWQSRIPTSYGRAILGGFLVLASFCGGFGLWAATAPISGAVIASGVMRASGQNKLVDHLDGGVITSIPVHEGETVKAGDVLLTIDTTRTTAERDRISMALMSATAQLARARAEQNGAEHLVLPEPLRREAEAAGASGDIAAGACCFCFPSQGLRKDEVLGTVLLGAGAGKLGGGRHEGHADAITFGGGAGRVDGEQNVACLHRLAFVHRNGGDHATVKVVDELVLAAGSHDTRCDDGS